MDWKQHKQSWPLDHKSSDPATCLCPLEGEHGKVARPASLDAEPNRSSRREAVEDAPPAPSGCDPFIREEHGDADPSDPVSTQDGRAGHARVQAWRAQDRARQAQSQKSEASDRDRAQRGRRLEIRQPEGAAAQFAPHKTKERRGETGQAAAEGRRRSSHGRSGDGKTRDELYREARRRDIPGRSKMNKQQLERALHD